MENKEDNKKKINHLRKLIKIAKRSHKEYPEDEYDLLIKHYKKTISELK